MIRKHKVIQTIGVEKLIFILRHYNIKQAEKIVEHAIDGGVKVIELTMTTPGVLQLIEKLQTKYQNYPDLLLGIGTVLDDITARQAIISGAEFVVSPHLDPNIIKMCNRYTIPIIPGAVTLTEIMRAMESGADVIKLFPARSFDPQMINDIKAPLPQANIIPTGGVHLENIQDWLQRGAYAVGVGNDIYSESIEKNDYSLISQKVKQYIQKMKEI